MSVSNQEVFAVRFAQCSISFSNWTMRMGEATKIEFQHWYEQKTFGQAGLMIFKSSLSCPEEAFTLNTEKT